MDGRLDSVSLMACPKVKQQRAMTWQRGLGSKCRPSIRVVCEHGMQALCFYSLWWTNWYLYLPARWDFSLSARSMRVLGAGSR